MTRPPDPVSEPERGRVFAVGRRVRLGDVSPKGRLRLDATARYLQDIANDDAVDGDYSDIVAFRLPRKNSKEVLARYSGESLHDLRFRGGLEIR